jgi:hypothetical protein
MGKPPGDGRPGPDRRHIGDPHHLRITNVTAVSDLMAAARTSPATSVNGTLLPHDPLRRVSAFAGAGGGAVESTGLHGQ